MFGVHRESLCVFYCLLNAVWKTWVNTALFNHTQIQIHSLEIASLVRELNVFFRLKFACIGPYFKVIYCTTSQWVTCVPRKQQLSDEKLSGFLWEKRCTFYLFSHIELRFSLFANINVICFKNVVSPGKLMLTE